MYCQRCRTPLKLHGSLENLNPAAFHLLANGPEPPTTTVAAHGIPISDERRKLYEKASKDAKTPLFKRSVGSPTEGRDHNRSTRDGTSMSFVNITQSQVVPPAVAHKSQDQSPARKRRGSSSQSQRSSSGQQDDESRLSKRMETSTRLFEILSARSDIDHPICSECTEQLVDGMEKRLAAATRERDAYVEFVQNARAEAPTEQEMQEIERELADARKQEDAAFAELVQLEAQKAALEKEIADLELESQSLDQEEEEFWKERNALTETLREFQDERDSLNLKYDHDARLLERLQRTNVYDDTFYISHDGPFATINGLRMGRMSGSTVDWAETNAAWGQACLLLATIADMLGYHFRGYNLRPLGSTSAIDVIEPASSASRSSAAASSTSGSGSTSQSKSKATATYNLYHSSDIPVAFGFAHRSFDNAMVAFLECTRQLGKHVERASERSNKPVRLPYQIEDNKINGCSIKLGGFSGDETWTSACKYTLTCCKMLLAYASRARDSADE